MILDKWKFRSLRVSADTGMEGDAFPDLGEEQVFGNWKILVLKGRPAYADEIKKLASVSMPVKWGKIKMQLCQ